MLNIILAAMEVVIFGGVTLLPGRNRAIAVAAE